MHSALLWMSGAGPR